MVAPEINLPKRPERAEVLYAAACADIYVERLSQELEEWQDRAHDLAVKAYYLEGEVKDEKPGWRTAHS